MRFAAAFLSIASLAACGSSGGRDSLGLAMVGLVVRETGASTTAVESPGFTAELLAENPQDFMIVDVPNLDINQPARIIAKAGIRETWQGQGGATYAFHDGILVATRGLIDDLLVISSDGVRAALRAGGGTLSRTVESLDSLDQLSTRTMTCTITRNGPEEINLGLRALTLTKYTELCQSQALVFENAYWLDGTGEILSSRQFISAGVGYLISNRL